MLNVSQRFKDLIKRLHDDIAFKINCGFPVSDSIPTEASYSRLIAKLIECNILEKELENVGAFFKAV